MHRYDWIIVLMQCFSELQFFIYSLIAKGYLYEGFSLLEKSSFIVLLFYFLFLLTGLIKIRLRK